VKDQILKQEQHNTSLQKQLKSVKTQNIKLRAEFEAFSPFITPPSNTTDYNQLLQNIKKLKFQKSQLKQKLS